MQVSKPDDERGFLVIALSTLIGFAILLAIVVAIWWAVFVWALPKLFGTYIDFQGWKARDCVERGGTVTEGPLFGTYCVGPKR